MAPAGVSKEQCALLAVLSSGFGIRFVEEVGLRCLHRHSEGQEKQMMLPYGDAPTAAAADCRDMDFKQQTFVLKTSAVTAGSREHNFVHGRDAGE